MSRVELGDRCAAGQRRRDEQGTVIRILGLTPSGTWLIQREGVDWPAVTYSEQTIRQVYQEVLDPQS